MMPHPSQQPWPPQQPGYRGGVPPGGPPTITPFAGTTDTEITGIAAYGTLIQVLTNPGSTPEVFASIFGVGDISGPAVAIAEAETTSHSTGNPVRTFIPTLIDAGELSFPLYWNPGDPTQSLTSPYGLEFLFWNKIVTKFRLVNADPGHRTRTFQGYVKTLGENYPLAGVSARNATIRLAGKPVDAASATFLSATEHAALAAGGPGTFDVTTGGYNAEWFPVSTVAWATLTAPTSPVAGDDTVSYSVAPNTVSGSAARVGQILIAALNLTHTITQAGTP